MELGIYEQIINRFFKRKLDEMDQCKYYIGKKPIDKSNIADYLSQYLYALIKQLFNQLGDDDRDLQKDIKNTENNGTTEDRPVACGSLPIQLQW